MPNWNKVCQIVLGLAEYISFMPLLGWDVVLSADRVMIQEANYNPGVSMLQVHRPLLVDPGVRRFYEYHNVIPRSSRRMN